MDLDATLMMAVQHHQSGRLAEAEALYRQILQASPRHANALHLLGVLAMQKGDSAEAVRLMEQAVEILPEFAAAWSNLSLALGKLGRREEAVAACRRAVQLSPQSAEAHNNLGTALREMGNSAEAVESFRQALACREAYPEAHSNLGAALADGGRYEEAMAACRRALALRPGYAGAFYNLANALEKAERKEEALACYREAVTRKTDLFEAWRAAGDLCVELGRYDEGVEALRHAVELQPASVAAKRSFGWALSESGRQDEALSVLEAAARRDPSDTEQVHEVLASVLRRVGRIEDAIAVCRRAVERHPASATTWSHLLLLLHHLAEYEPGYIHDEHTYWGRLHAARLEPVGQSFPNERSENRRLRIGYVSADLRRHAVTRFILPLLANHDHARFEVFCYASVGRPDEVTARCRGYADAWRDITGLSDEAAAERVRADGIDILIDLAGHTGDNRLLLFARRPAPVQATFLGYPDTTGMAAMGWRITDGLADPVGMTERFHTETLLRLPESAWCFEPEPRDVEVGAAPVAARGTITFGSFNHAAKITEGHLKCWARILRAVEGSHLLLKHGAFGSRGTCGRFLELLGREGIGAERVELRPFDLAKADHMAGYRQVDIALDTYPYHGTTTTCEALWMGVPVVTLAGKTHVSRVGVSLLTNVGLGELVGQTEEEYVDIAVGLARDVPRLVELRAGLRRRMENSPLMDGARFARNVEAAYREMWRRWCEGDKGQEAK